MASPRPILRADRIAGLDLARGLAVVGMLAAHLFLLPDVLWSDPATWSGIPGGRSSILFATLAGVSIGLLTGGARPLAGHAMRTAQRRLLVRALVLWVIGILLVMTGVPVYVILPAYAVLFCLAVPFTGLSARTVLIFAAGLGVLMPFVQPLLNALPVWQTSLGDDLAAMLGWQYPFPVWIAFVIAGLGIARLDVSSLAVQVQLVLVGSFLAVVGYGLDTLTASHDPLAVPSYVDLVWTAREHSSGLLEVVGSGGFALAVIGLALLVCRTAVVWVVLPLRAVGAMPLTAYTAQLLVWAIWAAVALGDPSDLEGFRALDPFWAVTIGLLVSCTAWALLVGRGPLESLMALVTKLIVPDAGARGPGRLSR